MKHSDIRAGQRLDLVFEKEMQEAGAHVLKATVYDVEGGLLTISQTTPALNRRYLNRRLRVTYLVRLENRILRFGFPAVFVEILSDYAMSSGSVVEALVVKKTGRVESSDFRMFFRVKPPENSDICLFCREEKVNLLDISLGGAKFSCPKTVSVQPGQTLEMSLLVDGRIFRVDARVRNIHNPPIDSAAKTFQFVSVEFMERDSKMETALGRAILEIERALLSDGKL